MVAVNFQAIAGGERLAQLRRRDVAGTDVAHLARVHQVVHCLQRLLNSGLRIRLHRHVEIDVVSLQPAQAALDRLPEVATGKPLILRPAGDRIPDLGREDQLVADLSLGEPGADDRFRHAAPIAIGCVEVVDALVPGSVHQGEGGRLVFPLAE